MNICACLHLNCINCWNFCCSRDLGIIKQRFKYRDVPVYLLEISLTLLLSCQCNVWQCVRARVRACVCEYVCECTNNIFPKFLQILQLHMETHDQLRRLRDYSRLCCRITYSRQYICEWRRNCTDYGSMEHILLCLIGV